MRAPILFGPSNRSQRALDWLNFFIADVETAFGPFVSTYLSKHGWTQSQIGSVLTVNSGVALATQIPAGALVDWIKYKRLVIGVCLGLIAGGAMLIALFPSYPMVVAGEFMHGLNGGAVRTAIAAIGLGLVGHRMFHTRVGRNHRYDSLGNAATAAAMGALGYFISPRWPFFAAAALCLPGLGVLLLIRGSEIDYRRARAAKGRAEPTAARLRELARNRVLLVFGAAMFLFQFANASMLPLATERLTGQHQHESELITAALVVVPQVTTALAAAWVARKADEWGRKRLLLAGFAALIARAGLFALAFSPWYLVGVQVLGGLTAVVIGILTPLVVADSTRRTGRYNFSLGAVGMISGIGATISTTAMGFLAQKLGYTYGFIGLAAVAGIGFLVLWFLLPETVESARQSEEDERLEAAPGGERFPSRWLFLGAAGVAAGLGLAYLLFNDPPSSPSLFKRLRGANPRPKRRGRRR